MARARGVVASSKLDHNFKLGGRTQSAVGRYNFTDDRRQISKTGEAIFSTLEPKVRAQNFSFFFNSQLSAAESRSQLFNQVRLSYGRTRLRFQDVRPCTTADTVYSYDCLLPSDAGPSQAFLLNRTSLVNTTVPAGGWNAAPDRGDIRL